MTPRAKDIAHNTNNNNNNYGDLFMPRFRWECAFRGLKSYVGLRHNKFYR